MIVKNDQNNVIYYQIVIFIWSLFI